MIFIVLLLSMSPLLVQMYWHGNSLRGGIVTAHLFHMDSIEGFCLRGTAVAPFLKSMYPAHHELKGVFVIIIAVTNSVIIIISFCQAALPWHCIELSAYCLALLN